MLSDELRRAVMQAALQGKLTEQLPTDTSVDLLLDKVIEDRNRLIELKKYKVDKKQKTFLDDDMPFDIPTTWRWMRLGECSTYGQTKQKATSTDINSDIWSLDLEDIEKNTGRVINRVKAKERTITGDKIKFNKGNILYSKLRPYLLKILIADEDGICTPELIPFDMLGGINPEYILLVLKSPHVDYVINSVTYGVKMPRVGSETMINLMIPIPPIEEQDRIVFFVNNALKKIDEYYDLEKNMQELMEDFQVSIRESILQAALMGKITERNLNDGKVDLLLEIASEERENLITKKILKREKINVIEDTPFDIPEEWRFARLGSVIKLLSGQDFTPDKYYDNPIDDGIPYLTGASNIENGRILINRWTKDGRSIARRGELLLTCKGTVGTMAFLDVEEAHIARQIMAITPLANVNLNYIKYCLENFILTLKAKAKSAIPGIDRSVVLNLLIPIPPIEEQVRIVQRLDEILPICDTLLN